MQGRQVERDLRFFGLLVLLSYWYSSPLDHAMCRPINSSFMSYLTKFMPQHVTRKQPLDLVAGAGAEATLGSCVPSALLILGSWTGNETSVKI